MATIGTRLATMLFGKKVGHDSFGNVYYTNRQGKRWVIFKGLNEPSKVPSEWHSWLHHTGDKPLTDRKRHSWERGHLPNLTGTQYAYHQEGHTVVGGRRTAVSADYQPWQP